MGDIRKAIAEMEQAGEFDVPVATERRLTAREEVEEFEQTQRDGKRALAAQAARVESTIVESLIVEECDRIKELLVSKNRAYGNSALEPMRVFSRADTVEQIKVRIDDKLSRLSRGHALPDESLDDTTMDLIGYLVLLRVAKRRAR